MLSSPRKIFQVHRAVFQRLDELLSIPRPERRPSKILSAETVTRFNHFLNLSRNTIESVPRLLTILGYVFQPAGHVLQHLARIKTSIIELTNQPSGLLKRKPQRLSSRSSLPGLIRQVIHPNTGRLRNVEQKIKTSRHVLGLNTESVERLADSRDVNLFAKHPPGFKNLRRHHLKVVTSETHHGIQISNSSANGLPLMRNLSANILSNVNKPIKVVTSRPSAHPDGVRHVLERLAHIE